MTETTARSSVQRLTLVVAGYFPDSRGGAERQAQILAEALHARGVDVTLIAPTTWASAPSIENTSFGRIERFRVRKYPSAGGRHILDFLAWTFWFRKHITPRLDPTTPVYVFHARLHAFGPALAARASGAPFLIKLGGGGDASDFAALRAKRFLYGRWIQRYLLRNTSAFVANSKQIAEDLVLLKVPSDRIVCFPNGVVLPEKSNIQSAIARRSGRRFLSSGRMVADKNVGVLWEAASALIRGGVQLDITFLGEGPERGRLEAAAAAAGVSARVEFPGFVSDVYQYLEATDFFLSASMREGQSNALLEAMSAGVIPIVFGASGAEVVIHGETGFLVERSDPEAFRDAIEAALALSVERRVAMAQASRAYAASHIGIGRVAEDTIALITRLMAPNDYK
ncbi:glycosyltransferase family 4 protein [Sphingomonas sp. BIUV-7]|uniref:Glycosyltransferase family 4 protein n=1 Tax=Sphingomonas natans TaxID=3063330 RepID=A0ABT8YCM3_9SPHN|nr:glycosyltransferase family 4 protein [Sphingomonas sp. BIUV-7]MDO6416080.1 glycosyltransferase family 4 protein [Sphingomonas sp. BIUV-7]